MSEAGFSAKAIVLLLLALTENVNAHAVIGGIVHTVLGRMATPAIMKITKEPGVLFLIPGNGPGLFIGDRNLGRRLGLGGLGGNRGSGRSGGTTATSTSVATLIGRLLNHGTWKQTTLIIWKIFKIKFLDNNFKRF